jgi:hypothetical protein
VVDGFGQRPRVELDDFAEPGRLPAGRPEFQQRRWRWRPGFPSVMAEQLDHLDEWTRHDLIRSVPAYRCPGRPAARRVARAQLSGSRVRAGQSGRCGRCGRPGRSQPAGECAGYRRGGIGPGLGCGHDPRLAGRGGPADGGPIRHRGLPRCGGRVAREPRSALRGRGGRHGPPRAEPVAAPAFGASRTRRHPLRAVRLARRYVEQLGRGRGALLVRDEPHPRFAHRRSGRPGSPCPVRAAGRQRDPPGRHHSGPGHDRAGHVADQRQRRAAGSPRATRSWRRN